MRKLILISIVIFFAICSRSWALPECEGSPYVQVNLLEDNKNYWDNCVGTHIWNHSAGENSYVGEWKNNKYHGQGTYTSSHGNYIGEWKNGKRHGWGTQIWVSGNVWEGEWKSGNIRQGFKEYTALEYKEILIAKEKAQEREDERNRIENARQEEIKEKQTFENAKAECEAIGYKKGTEKFGECVLDLTE